MDITVVKNKGINNMDTNSD